MLEMALINGKGKKGKKKKSKAKKSHAKKYGKKSKAKKVSSKKKGGKKSSRRSKKRKSTSGGSVALYNAKDGSLQGVKRGVKVVSTKPLRTKKRKTKHKLSKNTRSYVRAGGKTNLPKGVRMAKPYVYKNPRKRKAHKRNPQFNLKQILTYAGGAAAAVVVHKYGVLMLGNVLSKLPVIGQYASKINQSKWANVGTKGALAALVFFGSKKVKNAQVKDAAKAYAASAVALAVLQALNIDNKLMVAQAGMGEIEMQGIELEGIELEGIEMDGIEEMSGIESMEGIEEMGDVYTDGVSGDEFVQ